jgi:hypothetical protein
VKIEKVFHQLRRANQFGIELFGEKMTLALRVDDIFTAAQIVVRENTHLVLVGNILLVHLFLGVTLCG